MQLITKCTQCQKTGSLQGDTRLRVGLRCTVCGFSRGFYAEELKRQLRGEVKREF